MLVGGPDSWHPNAEMFFRAGGGPLLDIAPYYLTAIVALLGRVESVSGFAVTRTPKRTLGAGPRAGETFAIEVPTHAAVVLRLKDGALATLTVSFEARGQYVSGMEIFGSEATLYLPDANTFGGEVSLRRGRGEPEPVPYTTDGARETRGLGVHELVESMRAGRPHQASGALALHVLEAADAVIRSSTERDRDRPRLVCAWVGRRERDARHAPGLVLAARRHERDRGPAAGWRDLDPALALPEGDVRNEREAERGRVERDRRVLVGHRHHHPAHLRDPWHVVSFREVQAYDRRTGENSSAASETRHHAVSPGRPSATIGSSNTP